MLNLATHWPLQFGPYSTTGGSFTQAGSGDPSPANIRAITPWKAAGASTAVVRTGKNLINPSALAQGSYTYGGITVTISGGRVTVTGTASITSFIRLLGSFAGNSSGVSSIYDVPLPGSFTQNGHTLSVSDVSGSITGDVRLLIQNQNSAWDANCLRVQLSDNSLVYKNALPSPAGLFYGLTLSCTSGAVCNKVFDIQLELGSTATAYEPYISKSATLAAPELYAGYMGDDWYWRRTVPNLLLNGTETWDDTNFAASGYFETTITAAHATPSLACSHFLPATSAAADSNKIIVSGTSLKVYPADAVATDKAGWLAWLASNNTRVAYQLATPVSIAPTIP